MNCAVQILNHLAASPDYSEVIQAPNLPAVERTESGIRPILSVVLSHQDIRETLSTFRSHSPSLGSVPVGKSGSFSFGMQNLGRYKVLYLTQRGTGAVAIRKIPVTIPDVMSMMDGTQGVQTLDELFSARRGGLILFVGPHAQRNSTLAYWLLKRVNERESRIVYILERNLSYLLRHDKSVVLQSELESDVDTMEEGIRNACSLLPDLLYVREVRGRSEMLAVLEAAEMNVLTIMDQTAMDETLLLADIEALLKDFYGNFRRLLRKIVKILPLENGRMKVELLDAG